MTARSYPAGENGPGALVTANYSAMDARIASARRWETTVPRDELERYLGSDPLPVLVDGELRVTGELTTADLTPPHDP